MRAGEHARAVTEEMEAMEALLQQPELSPEQVKALREHLEAAKVEAGKAREELDVAESVLGAP